MSQGLAAVEGVRRRPRQRIYWTRLRLRTEMTTPETTTPGPGHNQLKSIIERIERLEEEKKAISDDIRDVYAEAKGNGFDPKALRAIVRMRKQDADERREHETIVETYMQGLGMI